MESLSSFNKFSKSTLFSSTSKKSPQPCELFMIRHGSKADKQKDFNCKIEYIDDAPLTKVGVK